MKRLSTNRILDEFINDYIKRANFHTELVSKKVGINGEFTCTALIYDDKTPSVVVIRGTRINDTLRYEEMYYNVQKNQINSYQYKGE